MHNIFTSNLVLFYIRGKCCPLKIEGGCSPQYTTCCQVYMLYFYLLLVIWYQHFALMTMDYQMMKATVGIIPVISYVDILILKYIQTWYKYSIGIHVGIIFDRCFVRLKCNFEFVFSPWQKWMTKMKSIFFIEFCTNWSVYIRVLFSM